MTKPKNGHVRITTYIYDIELFHEFVALCGEVPLSRKIVGMIRREVEAAREAELVN